MLVARMWRSVMNKFALLLAVAVFTSGPAGEAQRPPPLPGAVLTRMSELDRRCTAAGGNLGTKRYIIARDFTGDGLLDYLLSEGDYDCEGRPSLFIRNGQARVEVFASDRSNAARLVYAEELIAYRVLDGRPVRLQVARRGAACGDDAVAQRPCAAELAWNGTTLSDRTAAVSPTPASPAQRAATLPIYPGQVEGTFLARCRSEYIAREASASRWADGQCRDDWKKVVASGAAAEALLAALPSADERPTMELLRTRLKGVRWSAGSRKGTLAEGQLGNLRAFVEGSTSPTNVGFAWAAVGAEIPFDVVNAMRAGGATLTLTSCEKIGVGEGVRHFAGFMAGKAPFSLKVEQRTAPTGISQSYYSFSVSLDRRRPPQGTISGCDFL